VASSSTEEERKENDIEEEMRHSRVCAGQQHESVVRFGGMLIIAAITIVILSRDARLS